MSVEDGVQMTDNPMHAGNATAAVITAPSDSEWESASLLMRMREKLNEQTERMDRFERQLTLVKGGDKQEEEKETSEIVVQV